MPKRKPKDLDRSPDLPHNWIERHLTRLEAFLYTDPIVLDDWAYRRYQLVSLGRYQEIDPDWRTIQIGEMWGGPDTTAFFKKDIVIPESHAGPDAALDIEMDGGETQLLIDGYPWQGLDYYRSIVPLGEHAVAGRELELSMEAFIINYPYDERRHDERDLHRFERARLVKINRKVEAFLNDAGFVLDAYLSYFHSDAHFEIEDYLRHALEEACRAVGPLIETLEQAEMAADFGREILKQRIFDADVYRHNGSISVIAQSHLDIVYLWPLKETIRKNGRTTTNMLNLMRENPEFIYSQSQPYLYEKLQEHYPEVFQEVKQRIQEGRWEAVGAMYIEPDCNVIGGESMVRQILFGKRYLREQLGVDTSVCWMPDVFGVMYTLPQILIKSGVKYFSTVKLNIWNDTNEFPYDTFRWRGPDGSEVLTHFPPTHFGQAFGYDNLRRHWRDFRERDMVQEALFAYGLSDGGGGPTREMVASSLRSKDFPGLPPTQIEFVETFFNRLDTKAERLPVWDDELYLEAHRGTYTTKGELKRSNRKSEILYRDAEALSALASLFGGPPMQERINQGWKLLLLNQFHDTLPGTHVPVAVPDIREDYHAIFNTGQAVLSEVKRFIARRINSEAAAENDLLLFNTLSWERNDFAVVSLREGATSVQVGDGDPRPVQHYEKHTYFRTDGIPSLGWTMAKFSQSDSAATEVTATFADNVIETPMYRIEVNPSGELGRIFDKQNDRDVLSGPGNQLQIFEDDPGRKFSAWDIASHFETYQHAVKQTEPWTLIENGPLFAVFVSEWQVLDSTIEQEMWLFADYGRIDFHTRAEWRNHRKLLKVAFPLEVRSRSATYDLPFGHIERPTHRNTTWEQAKFEVSGHKWADLSEGNYGVALLNDCKYGYDVRENVMRLSLIRSPIRPDGNSDIGYHTFVYSLLPHKGNWREEQIDRRAYELNIPVLASSLSGNRGGEIPGTFSFAALESDAVIVEALKPAESGNGLILRTFDSHGTHNKATVTTACPMAAAAETNLLEEEPVPVDLDSPQSFTAHYTPYEIKTHHFNFG